MRTCCCSDENKPHQPDCPKEEAWRKKQNAKVRSADLREKRDRKVSRDGDRRR